VLFCRDFCELFLIGAHFDWLNEYLQGFLLDINSPIMSSQQTPEKKKRYEKERDEKELFSRYAWFYWHSLDEKLDSKDRGRIVDILLEKLNGLKHHDWTRSEVTTGLSDIRISCKTHEPSEQERNQFINGIQTELQDFIAKIQHLNRKT
jgi:hypothetical protein